MLQEIQTEDRVKFMEATLSCIGDGVIVTDRQGRLLYINAPGEKMTGWRAADAAGRHFDEIFRLVDFFTKEKLDSPIRPALALEKAVGLQNRSALMTRDGELIFVSASCSPIKSSHGAVEGAVVVFRDISRIKKAEEEVKREKNNLRNILEALPSGILVVDGDTVVKWANKPILDVLENGTPGIVGHRFGEGTHCINSYEKGCGEGRSCGFCEIRKYVGKVLREGVSCKDAVIRHTVLNGDGEECLWFKVTFIPFAIPDEEQIILAIDDITEQKKYEAALEKGKAEAESANVVKSEFLANMSHEIRTPLNGLVGMMDLLMLSDINEEQKEYINMAKFSATSLLKVINDILDLSRMEAGKLVIERADFDVRRLTEETVKLHAVLAKNKGLQLKYSVSADIPPYLAGDPDRIRQILNNLIVNAIKFTDSGEVRVEVNRLSMAQREVELRFSISDTGIGISDEKKNLLFQRFSQVDGSSTRKYGGTGLGLAICKQLAEMMGGGISVESEPRRGSVFHFTVRLEIGSKPQVSPEHAPAADEAPVSLSVLVVDDNQANQLILEKALERKGHSIDIAGDGLEALALHGRNRYDAVLMDIQMPVMDGIEATRIIREKEGAGRHTPIIAVTACALSGDRERFMAAGMDEYLPKPIKIEELYNIIERIAEEKNGEVPEQYGNIRLGENGELIFAPAGEKPLQRDVFPELEELEQVLYELQAAIKEGRFTVIEGAVHKVKKLAIRINEDRLTDLAFKAELAARKSDWSNAVERCRSVVEEFKRLKYPVRGDLK